MFYSGTTVWMKFRLLPLLFYFSQKSTLTAVSFNKIPLSKYHCPGFIHSENGFYTLAYLLYWHFPNIVREAVCGFIPWLWKLPSSNKSISIVLCRHFESVDVSKAVQTIIWTELLIFVILVITHWLSAIDLEIFNLSFFQILHFWRWASLLRRKYH